MNIMIVAGGTGGHLYPGIALAKALSGHKVTFVVRRGDLGRDILQKEGLAFKEISGQGLPRAFSLRALIFPINFVRSWVEAAHLLREIRPERVVGMGGYLSFPVVFLAHWLGIRTLLHEQNAFPGLANRCLSRWSDSVAVSFPASQAYFPKNKTWVSGLPIRPDIGSVDRSLGRRHFGLDPQLPTILVFGGSLGSSRLNTISAEAWPLLTGGGIKFQVIHITGAKDFDRVQKLYERIKIPVKLLPYCHAMAEAYAAANGVISRAGASTIAELLSIRCPALLIPYPYATNNHQVFNAQVLTSQNLGKMILDSELTAFGIADFFAGVLKAAPPVGLASGHTGDAAQCLVAHLL